MTKPPSKSSRAEASSLRGNRKKNRENAAVILCKSGFMLATRKFVKAMGLVHFNDNRVFRTALHTSVSFKLQKTTRICSRGKIRSRRWKRRTRLPSQPSCLRTLVVGSYQCRFDTTAAANAATPLSNMQIALRKMSLYRQS